MVGVSGRKVPVGQANGPDVELIVSGTEFYATYETVEGFPAVYDDALGLFCYARVVDGSYESTGVPVTAATPSGVQRHAVESDQVRAAKISQRSLQMERRAQKTKRED